MPIGLQPLSAGNTNSSGISLITTASPLVSLSVSALRNRRGLFALRARMGNPGPVAAALIGAFDADAGPGEPERRGAAPPAIDPVDDRHHRSAVKAGRHLADYRIEPGASDRQRGFAGSDRNTAAASGVDAQFPGAVEGGLRRPPGA